MATSTCLKCGVATTGEKFLRCGQCRTVRYCSEDCQRADWPNHKAVCKPLSEHITKDAKKTDSEFRAWLMGSRTPLADLAVTLLGFDHAAYSDKAVEMTVVKTPCGRIKALSATTCDRAVEELPIDSWEAREIMTNLGPGVYSPLFRFYCTGFNCAPFVASMPVPFLSKTPRTEVRRLERIRAKGKIQGEVNRILRDMNRE